MTVLPYRLCDVFTDRPLAGNALAVFTHAEELDGATMQLLAREMNLSESAFVQRPTEPGADAALRIFTPTQELPFAGHPTLGTAFVLAQLRTELGRRVRLQTGRGIVTVELSARGSGPQFGWMTQPHPRLQRYDQERRLLGALGVQSASLPLELYDNGPHFVLVVLAQPEQVARLRPDMAELAALGSIGVAVLAGEGAHWKMRVFAPGKGVPEDPATGAAAGPTALHLCRHGRIAYGDEITIAQGVEVGRPSTLQARITGNAERLTSVEVGGQAVVIGRGEIELP